MKICLTATLMFLLSSLSARADEHQYVVTALPKDPMCNLIKALLSSTRKQAICGSTPRLQVPVEISPTKMCFISVKCALERSLLILLLVLSSSILSWGEIS